MSFIALPLELVNLISSFTGPQDLKCLRATCSAFLTPATSWLFMEIHISPNSHSFDRALAVSESEVLRYHVKSLMYHYGMLGDFYAGFEAFRHEYFSARKPGESRDPTEITTEVLWCYNCWLEELDAQRTFELRDEEEELRQLCRRLPKLEQITTLLDDVDDIAEPKDYIGMRTGMAAAEDLGEYRFARLFRALHGQSLSKIAARSIGWHDLGDLVQGQEDDERPIPDLILPDTLNHLELGLYNPLSETSSDDIHIRCQWLDVFLSKARMINTLRLDFDELPFESHAELMMPISRTIFGHSWSRLRCMKLEAIACHEDDLCEFLLSHAATLCDLQLGDIELVKSVQSLQRPSILRLFRRLQQGLSLKSFRITGNFTNRTTQAWYVDIEAKPTSCLRDLIEIYVCSSDDVHRKLQITNSHYTLKALAESYPSLLEYLSDDNLTMSDWECFCDESWYWSPELLVELESSP